MRRNVPLGGIVQTAWGKSPLPLQVKGLAALNFSSMSERMLTVRTDLDEEDWRWSRLAGRSAPGWGRNHHVQDLEQEVCPKAQRQVPPVKGGAVPIRRDDSTDCERSWHRVSLS